MKVFFPTLSNINPTTQVQPEGLLSVKIVINDKPYQISEEDGRLVIMGEIGRLDIRPHSSNHISITSI